MHLGLQKEDEITDLNNLFEGPENFHQNKMELSCNSGTRKALCFKSGFRSAVL